MQTKTMIKTISQSFEQMFRERLRESSSHQQRLDAINAAKTGSSVEMLEKAAGRKPVASWAFRRKPRITMF